MTLRRTTTIGLGPTLVMLESWRGIPMAKRTMRTVYIGDDDDGKTEIRNRETIQQTGKLPRPPQGNHKSRRLGG